MAKVFLTSAAGSVLLSVLVGANGLHNPAVTTLIALTVLLCTTTGVLIGRSHR
jgi:hypothetical protein